MGETPDYKVRKMRAKIDQLTGRVEGLEADLADVVRVAYNRGATEYVRLNYPVMYARFQLDLPELPASANMPE